jgi:hypothetical protein
MSADGRRARPAAGGDRTSILQTGDVSLGKQYRPNCPVVCEAIIDQIDQMSMDEIDADMAAWTDQEWREVLDAVALMRRDGLLP